MWNLLNSLSLLATMLLISKNITSLALGSSMGDCNLFQTIVQSMANLYTIFGGGKEDVEPAQRLLADIFFKLLTSITNYLKIILQEDYLSYSNALSETGLTPLFERRANLSLKFAKGCVRNHQARGMFPLNPIANQHNMTTRHREKFKVNKAKTERLKTSAIPYMQRLLNKEKWSS